jgi:photosystem II stability/assembly factor-like uncharacterized protein
MEDNQLEAQIASQRGIQPDQVARIAQSRGLTTEAVAAIPDASFQRSVRRLDYADMPRSRDAFRRLQQRDEAGTIPPNALSNALSQLDSTRTRAAAVPQVAGVPTGTAVDPRAMLPGLAGLAPAGAGWTSIGPGNIGGRTRSIVIHPTNTKRMWAGSVGGGVWTTADGGANWSPVNDFMANLAVCCMAMDPTNPNVIYAGTGEGFQNVDSIRGAGIFHTVDGATWTQLPSTVGPEFQTVNRLAISPDGKTLLAATRTGMFRSTDSARLTWTRTLAAEVVDVKFHPSDATKAVAGGRADGKAYFSTDGGATWTESTHSTAWEGRVELTYSVRRPTNVYASVQMRNGEIWRSTNGGQSYTRRKTLDPTGRAAPYLGDQGWYDNVIWAGDPTDHDLVIVGGINLWRSTDGGNTLRPISTWWEPKSVHADQHYIVSSPGYDGVNNRTVFIGNDGGIFTTANIKTAGNEANDPRVHGWQELVNSYGVTQFYGGAGNATSGRIIGGAQDNGTLLFTPESGADGWTTMFGGDGGWCAADPTDTNVFYGEYVNLNIHRSLDGGNSAEFISGQFWSGFAWEWKPIPFRIPDAFSGRALFIAPFILDPNAPNRILAGGASLWRTDDAKTPNTNSTGPAWVAIKGTVGHQVDPTRPSSRISALAVAPGKSAIVWVGHEDGQVFASSNGTDANPTWQKIDGVGPQPLSVGRYCTGITIDPKNNKIVYVTFGGYTRGNVWKTTDSGATWSNIGNSLPAAPARALAVHPVKSKLLYLGTEVGVFASDDGGNTWSPTNEGPTNCSVDDLFWMDKTLICVTHGRGMFKIDLAGA